MLSRFLRYSCDMKILFVVQIFVHRWRWCRQFCLPAGSRTTEETCQKYKVGITKLWECELQFSFWGIMPIDINDLWEGWLELESDPGKNFSFVIDSTTNFTNSTQWNCFVAKTIHLTPLGNLNSKLNFQAPQFSVISFTFPNVSSFHSLRPTCFCFFSCVALYSNQKYSWISRAIKNVWN